MLPASLNLSATALGGGMYHDVALLFS